MDEVKTKLKPSEVAALLGVHINTVKRMATDELPYFRLNDRGDRRYDRRDVEAFIRRRLVR